jgi:hypothetical protein
MKRIARTLVIVTLAGAATAATAADSPFPSSSPNTSSLSMYFPNMDSYEREHRNSEANQQAMSYPSSAPDQRPLATEFSNIVTYKQEHRNDPVQASSTPTFPYSAPNTESMADEGLVAGIAGVAPYVDNNNQTSVGATR